MRAFTGFEKGINFGGWLSQCDHTKERYDTFITDKDFEEVKSRGYDHVRVPVDYELFANDNLEFHGNGLSYIDFAVEQCRKNGLHMVLDLHRTVGFSFDPGHNKEGFFEKDEYQNFFYEIWEKLSERYGKYSDMLAFEMLNEVTKKEYCEPWNRISTECIKRIRKFAPDTWILLGGYYNNSIEALKDLALPYDDKIVYNFHCYEPLLFTHQGAYWIPSMDRSFRFRYKSPFRSYEELSQKQLCQAFAGFDDLDPNQCPDERFFENLISEAVRVAEERNVPLYCGEYGVIELADRADAKEWFRDFHAVMDKYSVGRAVWTYKEMDFEAAKDL